MATVSIMSVVDVMLLESNTPQLERLAMDNEQVQELFDMFHEGEISAAELMSDLDFGGFDGDLIDFL
jgi:hypothetical protein